MTTRRWLGPLTWLTAGALGVVLFRLVTTPREGFPFLGDLHIYRESVLAASGGGSLYDYVLHRPDIRPEGFGFTYPPLAGLVLWPLAWVDEATAGRLWTLASLASVAVIAGVVVARRRRRPDAPLAGTAAGLLTLMLGVSYPVISDLILGQVSLLVVGLTLVDAVAVPRRWRGLLTGLAGALKLLPLVFVAYFLATKQWAAAVRAAVSFGAATLLAFVVFPADSVSFWTVRLWQTSNVGDPASNRNRALFGLLIRAGGDQPWVRWAWLVVALAVVVLGLRAAARHAARDEPVEAAVVVGCLAIAAAPISWTHYLGWGVLAGWILLGSGLRWAVVGLAATVLLSFPSPMMAEDPGPSLLLRAGQELPGLFVAGVAVLGLPRRGVAPGREAREASAGGC